MKPLPLWSLSKTLETGSYALSSPSRTTLLLVAKESDDRIAGNFREKVELLSLKSHTFPLSSICSFSSSLSLSQSIWSRLGQEKSHLNATCQAIIGSSGLHPYPYPTTMRFPSNGMMPCVTCEPTLELMFDCICTRHVAPLGHPKRAKCPASPPVPQKK